MLENLTTEELSTLFKNEKKKFYENLNELNPNSSSMQHLDYLLLISSKLSKRGIIVFIGK